MAIDDALELVHKTGDLPVPLHLRNSPTNLMKEIGYGKDYKYAHAYENNFINIEFLPHQIAGRKLYDPGKNAREEDTRKWLRARWGGKYEY
jgi:putative ATPase